MCFIVLPKPPVMQLCTAAQRLQDLLQDGTLAAAFGDGSPDQAQSAIAAFDRLAEVTAALVAEQKPVSPFLRYRQEILGETPMGSRLRSMVRCMAESAFPYSLNRLFLHADQHHTRIALECIASYTNMGETDTFFMTLASEINEMQPSEVEA